MSNKNLEQEILTPEERKQETIQKFVPKPIHYLTIILWGLSLLSIFLKEKGKK
jgi:hypothetical protein